MGPTGTENDVFSKLEMLRLKDPESYVKYRKHQKWYVTHSFSSRTLSGRNNGSMIYSLIISYFGTSAILTQDPDRYH